MNSEPAFAAPFAKVQRAKTQIDDLNNAIKSFFEATPYEIVSEVDPQTEEEVWRFKLARKIPADLSVRVGEIFHNLRTSLDQMLAEIVVRVSKRTDKAVTFPISRDFAEFETALGKQEKLPADARTIIRNLQPYQGGDPLLWLLHSANRRDKHRMGLVPINLRTGGKTSWLSVWFGQALVIGSRSGQHLLGERRLAVADYLRLAARNRVWATYGLYRMDLISGLPLAPDVGNRMVFENPSPGSSEDTMEFLTATPGTKFKTDFEPTFDVAFRDIGGFERKPIVYVLADLRDLVERILLTFRNRFFP